MVSAGVAPTSPSKPPEYYVQLEFSAAGTVSDFDNVTVHNIAVRFADRAHISHSLVEVLITGGSVRVTVMMQVWHSWLSIGS